MTRFSSRASNFIHQLTGDAIPKSPLPTLINLDNLGNTDYIRFPVDLLEDQLRTHLVMASVGYDFGLPQDPQWVIPVGGTLRLVKVPHHMGMAESVHGGREPSGW